jgi:hypothetical protein
MPFYEAIHKFVNGKSNYKVKARLVVLLERALISSAMAADVPITLLASPNHVKHFQPLPTLPPIPQLATFTDGIACKLCPADQIYICCQNVEKLK